MPETIDIAGILEVTKRAKSFKMVYRPAMNSIGQVRTCTHTTSLFGARDQRLSGYVSGCTYKNE